MKRLLTTLALASALTAAALSSTPAHAASVIQLGKIQYNPAGTDTAANKGTNSTLVRYWSMGYHVWNNGGDTATLRNAAGAGMDSCRWTSAGNGYINC